MGIFEAIVIKLHTAIETMEIGNAVIKHIKKTQIFEQVLAKSIHTAYDDEKEGLKKYATKEIVHFDETELYKSLCNLKNFEIDQLTDFEAALIPILKASIHIADYNAINDFEYNKILQRICKNGIESFWKSIHNYDTLTNQVLLSSSVETNEKLDKIIDSQKDGKNLVATDLNEIKNVLKQISDSTIAFGLPGYNAAKETATPAEQGFDNKVFKNPFALVRAEDFNHNYGKLAKLFQSFPEWEAAQSRTNNVFIIGGRGTGKSMILRRMSIQTIISDYHNNGNTVITLDNLNEDYYGIYIKLIRGTYTQYDNNKNIPKQQLDYLAQHELNINIIDAFKDSIEWLIKKSVVNFSSAELRTLLSELSELLCDNSICNTFEELSNSIKHEQKAIHRYFRNKTFEKEETYSGNATDSSSFVTDLSKIFRKYFCKEVKDFRLILLIDEYEALAEIQQIAINTIIKNRLPDLTVKLAMRKDSIKTRDTFTPGEPIQEPRDFSTLNIVYETDDENYTDLLKGICSKRLKDSGYSEHHIEKFLKEESVENLYNKQKIELELTNLWNSGNRKEDTPNQEFFTKYMHTAIYRAYSVKNSRFVYCGFEQYKFLSFGIISNFLELCKYTFYFALTKEIDLHLNPVISPKIQSHSVYYVSDKLFDQIDGNVPEVGPILKQFLTDLGSLIRTKMLKHTSETECNRVAIVNYNPNGYKDSLLSKVLQKGNTWSVINFYKTDETSETKNTSTPKANELVINRIYCPHLSVSPRSRWSISIDATDITGLLGEKSGKYYRKIVSEIIPSEKNKSTDSSFQFND